MGVPGRFLVVLATVATAGAAVLLDDTFADNERATQNLPSSAQWVHHASTNGGSASAASGSLVMDQPAGGSGYVVGYFTNAGSVQALGAVGDVLTLSFNFSFGTATTSGDRIRFGIFNSSGSRASSDGASAGDPAYNGWRGYGVFGGDANNAVLTVRERTANNDALWTGAVFPQFPGNGVTSPALATGVIHTASLRLERTAAGVALTGALDPNGFVAADTTNVFTNFDAVSIWSRSEIDPFTLERVTVTFTPASATNPPVAITPLTATNVTVADGQLTALVLAASNYTSDDLVLPVFTAWASPSGGSTEFIIAETGLPSSTPITLTPEQRRALLESDFRLDTAWANLSTSPGAGQATFTPPLTNRPGPDLVLFEVSTASTGDPFAIAINGVTLSVPGTAYGDTGHDTVSADTVDLRTPDDTANTNATNLDDLLNNPVRLSGNVAVNQNVLGLALDLADFGVAPDGLATNIALHSLNGSAPVDFVFIAGIVPGARAQVFEITRFELVQTQQQVTLEWRSKPGLLYSILQSTNLQPGSWTPVVDAIPSQGTSTSHSFTNTEAGPQRFYRIEQLARPVVQTVPDDGYRGIWYANESTGDEYVYKYSGGLATYPQQHAPIAIYRSEVEKTFFVYGGTTARQAGDPQQLLHMISYFDHRTGTVPRPRLLLNKQTSDAHDNPTLAIDDAGHLWIFSTSHGTSRPSYLHRSRRPYSIDAFERVLETNFSYAQPWHLSGQGFLFLHTHYGSSGAIRRLHFMTSTNGFDWTAPTLLAAIELGDYQISWPRGGRLATAFDFHPSPTGLNTRANIYYLETDDFAQSWRTVDGQTVTLPLTTTNNPALAYDSRAGGKLVYLKDLNYDAQGRPVILFLTSSNAMPGPQYGPREWKTMRWTGNAWDARSFTTSGNNYDHGSLHIETDGTWRVIAPTEAGPQPYNPGGEMVLWTSADQGATWTRVKQLTTASPRNHTYARRPLNAHPAFYALWADGHARQPSESNLYFTDKDGTHVWRLPTTMTNDATAPEIAW